MAVDFPVRGSENNFLTFSSMEKRRCMIRHTYFSPYKNLFIEDGPNGEYLTDRMTDEAVKFIEESKEVPFFLYLQN